MYDRFLYVTAKDDWMNETIAQRLFFGISLSLQETTFHTRLRPMSRQYLNIAIFERNDERAEIGVERIKMIRGY